MPGQSFTLAQESSPGSAKHYSPMQRAAIRDWAAWTGLLILAIMLFAGFVLVILGRQRKEILRPLSGRGRRKRPKPRSDAWKEAGRRLDIRELGTADDDTVDIDPDELDPGDVDERADPDDEPGDKPPRTGGPRR